MSGGFSDPIIGGGGSLVYPSIHSPNFVTGSTGWSINKDGSAEFNNLTVRNGTVISGVFLLYSSAIPAKGNLVCAFAPISGGTDSVGNVYPQGFNFGVWSASTGALLQHFGIDTSGRLYLADSTGVTRIFLDPSLAAQLIYDTSGISAGHLLVSIASAAGTDSAGNAFPAGVSAYVVVASGGNAGTWAANLSAVVTTFLGSLPALTFQNLTTPLNQPPSMAGSKNSGGTGSELVLSSGKQNAGGAQSGLILTDDAFGSITGGLIQSQSGEFNVNIVTGGGTKSGLLVESDAGNTPVAILQYAILEELAAPAASSLGPAVFGDNAAGMLRFRSDSFAGDGNNYATARLSLSLGGDTPIPSTSATTLMSAPVAAGITYRIEGIVKGVQGPNAAGQVVRFSGPAVSFNMIAIESNAVGNTSVTDSDLGGALPVDHVTPAWAAGVTFYVRFRGILTFTAAGTFAVQGRANSNVNTWTAKGGSLCDLMPV